MLLRDRRLWLFDDSQLLDELGRVRLRETSPGVLRMDHDPDKHDDRDRSRSRRARACRESGHGGTPAASTQTWPRYCAPPSGTAALPTTRSPRIRGHARGVDSSHRARRRRAAPRNLARARGVAFGGGRGEPPVVYVRSRCCRASRRARSVERRAHIAGSGGGENEADRVILCGSLSWRSRAGWSQ
jgi:hypothetical protein